MTATRRALVLIGSAVAHLGRDGAHRIHLSNLCREKRKRRGRKEENKPCVAKPTPSHTRKTLQRWTKHSWHGTRRPRCWTVYGTLEGRRPRDGSVFAKAPARQSVSPRNAPHPRQPGRCGGSDATPPSSGTICQPQLSLRRAGRGQDLRRPRPPRRHLRGPTQCGQRAIAVQLR